MAAEQPKKVTGGAFGRFLSEKRGELVKECSGKPSSAVVKLASERFKALGEAEKAEYQEKYSQAVEQYNKDMEAFLAGGGVKMARKRKGNKGEEGAKKRKKDPEAPKKPAGGAFGCFLAKHRAEFQEQTKGQRATAVVKLASEKWKVLSEEEKKPFEEEFTVKMDAYRSAMKDYVPPEPQVDEKAAAKEAKEEAKQAKKQAKDEAKEDKAAAKEAKEEAKQAEKQAKDEAKEDDKAAAKEAKEEAKQAKKQAKDEAKEKAKQAKEAKKQAKEAKKQAKEASKTAKAEGKSAKAKAKVRALGRGSGGKASTVELQETVAAKAEKEGLKEKLIQLASRQDIIDSKKSQAAIFKALQESGGMIHPAKRALLGA